MVLIGESGSGKSTLLKALAGVTHPSAGSVTVSGEPVRARRADVGYLPQDEIVHPLLTVREALRYSARLRLPDDAGPGDVDKAVDHVLAGLALLEHADKRIGSLSGGQRKRAGLASELLGRPSLLFLDEPTTGLDPGLETRMMELFRTLAEPGRRSLTVVTHATRNLDLADKVGVIGGGGDLCFFGPPEEATAFFGVAGYDEVYEALERRPASEWRRDFDALRGDAPAASTVSVPMGRERPYGRRSLAAQTAVLAHRYARVFGRDRRNLLILLGQVPLIAACVALLFRPGILRHDGGEPADAASFLFILATAVIWIGSIDGAREIVKERGVWARERAVGVRPGAYLASKLVVLFALAALQTGTLVLIALGLRRLHEPPAAYATVVLLLAVTAWAAVGHGLLISAVARTEDQATSAIPVSLIPQLLFAGAIVPLAQATGLVEAVAAAVLARWSFASLGTAVDKNARLAADPGAAAATGYGTGFFDVPAIAGAGAIGVVLVLVLGGTWAVVRARD